MQYIEIQDGKVLNHYCGPSIPADGREYKQVDDLTGGATVGTPVNQIDDTGRLYTPDELVKKKILKKKKNETLVYEDGAYVVYPDFTSANYWYKQGGGKVEFRIGQIPDDTMVKTANPHANASWTGKKWVIPDVVLSHQIRTKRNMLLSHSDHLVMPDYPITNKEEVSQYRQELRDISNQPTFPQSVEWPEIPELQKQGATK